MMPQRCKHHSAKFKARAALKAVKGAQGEAAREYQVRPVQISRWKRQLLERLPEVWNGKASLDAAAQEATVLLYEEIGHL